MVPVTRQTEDGSFELVYEAVSPEGEDQEEAFAAPVPAWRRKALFWGAFGAVALILLVGGLVAVVTLLGPSNPKARKVLSAKGAGDSRSDKAYEYVPPAKNDGRIDLNVDDDEEPPRVANTPEPTRAPIVPTRDVPPDPGLAGGSAGAAGGGVAPALRDAPEVPGLRPELPRLQPRLGDPLKVRQDLLRDRLQGTRADGVTGATGATGDPTTGDPTTGDPTTGDDGTAGPTGEPEDGDEGAGDEEGEEGEDGDEEDDGEASDDQALDEEIDDEGEREDDEAEAEDDERPE